jgi:hypothetical protein
MNNSVMLARIAQIYSLGSRSPTRHFSNRNSALTQA